MTQKSPILRTLARLYAESKLGRTGTGQRDFLIDFKKLLAAAHCEDGDEREAAVRELRRWAGDLLYLEGPPRDLDIIHQVRLPLANETRLFVLIGETSPAELRQRFADQFTTAAQAQVPERWTAAWRSYCAQLAQAALQGGAVAPFSRDDLPANAELLSLLPALLAWHARGEESLIRFASCVLTGESKRLGELAAEGPDGKHRGKLGAILAAVTGGHLQCLEEVGISATPRSVLLHGPLKLSLGETCVDLGSFAGPLRLSEIDLLRAGQIQTSARRCLTVENETSFLELAKLHSGDLLVCTSYPGSATLALLSRLPESLEYWHFGDSDPNGFDILRDLRERSGRPFRPLHMAYRPAEKAPVLEPGERRLVERLLASPIMQGEKEALQAMLTAGNKGRFEQESLGRPTLKGWPFYAGPQ